MGPHGTEGSNDDAVDPQCSERRKGILMASRHCNDREATPYRAICLPVIARRGDIRTETDFLQPPIMKLQEDKTSQEGECQSAERVHVKRENRPGRQRRFIYWQNVILFCGGDADEGEDNEGRINRVDRQM
jgi:hypothetical protein